MSDGETEVTLNRKYKKGVIIIHAEMMSEFDHHNITSVGSDGHDVEIEPGESYEGMHIAELFLKGFHGNEGCFIDNLHIDCKKNLKFCE